MGFHSFKNFDSTCKPLLDYVKKKQNSSPFEHSGYKLDVNEAFLGEPTNKSKFINFCNRLGFSTDSIYIRDQVHSPIFIEFHCDENRLISILNLSETPLQLQFQYDRNVISIEYATAYTFLGSSSHKINNPKDCNRLILIKNLDKSKL